MLIPPIIHLNGTGANALESEYATALKAVKAARDAVGAITIHGRDYYTSQDPAAFDKARAAREDVWSTLHGITEQLQSVRIHINLQTTRI